MTIVHLLNTGVYSGAENVAIQIIEQCSVRAQIHFVYVGKHGEIETILEQKKIEFYPVVKYTILSVKKMCNDLQPDIIHAHDFTTAFFACMAKGKQIPVISHLHNNSPWIKRISLKSFAFAFIIKHSIKVLFVSEAIKKEYIFNRLLNFNDKIIGNPVCFDESEINRNNNDKEYDIIFVGRLTEEKDPIRFISLVGHLKKIKENIKVVMLGEGKLYGECERKIKEEELETVVEMKGFVSNPSAYYKKSKVLCLTSKWEGFGLVIFEALSHGLPVVATAVGGVVNLVTEACGRLCFYDQEFVEELKNLILDENYYVKKSRSAFEQARALDNMENYVNNMISMYFECV